MSVRADAPGGIRAFRGLAARLAAQRRRRPCTSARRPTAPGEPGLRRLRRATAAPGRASSAPPTAGGRAAVRCGDRAESARRRLRSRAPAPRAGSLGGKGAASLGDQRRGVGLRGEVVRLRQAAGAGGPQHLRPARPELGRRFKSTVPLDGGEEALGVAAQLPREGRMPGETPPSGACGESAASRRRRASSAWSGPRASTASGPAASTRWGGTACGKRPRAPPRATRRSPRPLRGEAREAARAGGDRHARARSQLGDRPTEGDQVAARGRRQRD